MRNCKFDTSEDHSNFAGTRFRLASIGLEKLESDVLALRLLTPSIFLVVNIMQLYYFHSGWMELITMPRYVAIQREKFNLFCSDLVIRIFQKQAMVH